MHCHRTCIRRFLLVYGNLDQAQGHHWQYHCRVSIYHQPICSNHRYHAHYLHLSMPHGSNRYRCHLQIVDLNTCDNLLVAMLVLATYHSQYLFQAHMVVFQVQELQNLFLMLNLSLK